MIYVIQTNTSLYNNKYIDFQSMIFKYSSWENYKDDLLNENLKYNPTIIGTMIGNIKPRICKIERILINDDTHFECIISNNFIKINIKAVKVSINQFDNLLGGN